MQEDRTLRRGLHEKPGDAPFSTAPDACMSCTASRGAPSAPRILLKLRESICRALVDTGASKSFLRKGLFPATGDASLTILLGDGSRAEVTSKITLPVEVGPLATTHTFYEMSELPEECLLGMDFLVTHDLSIRIGDRDLQVGDTWKRIPFLPQTEDGVWLACARNITLPARSARIVPAIGSSPLDSGITEASENLEDFGLLLPRGFHRGEPQFLAVTNSREESIRLPVGPLLATMQESEETILTSTGGGCD